MSTWSPVSDIKAAKTKLLNGVKIALCVTGSVAAYKAVDIARELIRHGANVVPVLTKKALELVGEKLFHWATGEKPVVELSGRLEHVYLAGDMPGSANVILVAPATATTLARISIGDASTTVTAVVNVALGSGKPVIVAPAMHEQMYRSPAVKAVLKRLSELGVYIIEPEIAEGKAKIASTVEILEGVISALRRKTLAGKKILVTAGPTIEYIDPIRILTNKSSGKMGAAIAYEALARGASVTIIAGRTSVDMPRRARVIHVETSSQMLEVATSICKDWRPDLMISAAAISDFKPDKVFHDKLPSTKSISINLVPTEKVIDKVSELGVNVVAFRAMYKVRSDDELVEAGREYLREHPGVSCVAVNDVSVEGLGFQSDYNRYAFVSRRSSLLTPPDHKRVLASYLLDFIEKELAWV